MFFLEARSLKLTLYIYLVYFRNWCWNRSRHFQFTQCTKYSFVIDFALSIPSRPTLPSFEAEHLWPYWVSEYIHIAPHHRSSMCVMFVWSAPFPCHLAMDVVLHIACRSPAPVRTPDAHRISNRCAQCRWSSVAPYCRRWDACPQPTNSWLRCAVCTDLNSAVALPRWILHHAKCAVLWLDTLLAVYSKCMVVDFHNETDRDKQTVFIFWNNCSTHTAIVSMIVSDS